MLRKINRKLKKLLKQIIIYNRQLKPKSAYPTIEKYTRATPGSVCKEIYPEGISTLAVSDEFKSRFINYVETTTTAQIPAARVVQIPNGRVHTDNNASVAIISADNKVIGELTFTLGSDEPYDNNIFRQNYFEPPKYYKGTVFTMLIGEGGIVNYSHWLVDSISRIELLKKSGWFDTVDWFLVPSSKYDFQRDSLRMLGIDESKIIEGEKEPHIQADTIIATTYVRYHEHNPGWSIRFLQNHFLTPETKNLLANKYPYVYISRNDSAKRRVLNEPDVMQVLAPYGFVSFELSKLYVQRKNQLVLQCGDHHCHHWRRSGQHGFLPGKRKRH